MNQLDNTNSNKKHIYITILISSITVLMSGFISLVLTPYITNTVGVEAYGFVSLAKNFVAYANIVMTALNSYAARYMALEYMSGNYDRYKRYFSTVFIADIVLGGIMFVIGVVCVINMEHMLNISPELVASVKLLFLLSFFTFYVTAMTTVFAATGYVKDRLDIVNGLRCLGYVAEIIVLVFCFFIMKPTVWYVGLATVIDAALVLVGTWIMTKKLVPESKVKIKLYSWKAVGKLVGNGLWNSANSLGNTLNSGLDLIITNLLLTPIGMGQLSIAKTISGLVNLVYSTISQPFQPTFLKRYSDNDIDGLVQDIKYAMKVCGLITNLVFAGFCAIGLYFYRLWIPTQDTQLVYVLTILAMLPCITEGCMFPVYYVYTLTVKNKIPCFITIGGGLFNLVGMVVLLKFTNMGIYSIVITTAVVMNFINLITNPLYAAHCLKVKLTTFYPDIIRNIVACTVATGVMMLIAKVLPEAKSWGVLVLMILMYCAIGILIQAVILFGGKQRYRFGRNNE